MITVDRVLASEFANRSLGRLLPSLDSAGLSEIAVSVVICTRNRKNELRKTLNTLSKQCLPGYFWEILVVDNASDDGSYQELLLRADKPKSRLRVLREPQIGLSYARNTALLHARGRIVAFIDDDVTCDAGWLSELITPFKKGNVVAVGGTIEPALEEHDSWLSDLLPFEVGGPSSRYMFDIESDKIGRLGLPSPFGANMAMRRSAALEIGGFRHDLGWGKYFLPSEELEFFSRLRDASKGNILYVPGARVLHRVDRSRCSSKYYRQWQRAYGRAAVLLRTDKREIRASFHCQLTLVMLIFRGALAYPIWNLKRDSPYLLSVWREGLRAQGALAMLRNYSSPA